MPEFTKITNPESKKQIKIGGVTFNQLLKSGKYAHDEKNNKLVPVQPGNQGTPANTVSAQNHLVPTDNQNGFGNSEEARSASTSTAPREPPIEALRIVKLSDNELHYLVHISDVHIPLNIKSTGREEEYLIVFDRLYRYIALLMEQHPDKKFGIVITGDLMHTKINLRTDSLCMARTFLQRLAQMAPVFLICGNHDLNEQNLAETCTLTGIVQYLSPNIHYLERSGLYQYGSRIFVISSLKDAVFIRREDIPHALIEGMEDRLIYLYHGFLLGAKTDTGYQQKAGGPGEIASHSSRYRSPSDFNGFPLVLLGDVHKQQSLRNDDSMAYAGSLLQIDRSESLDRHGFLLWDLSTKKYEFHLVPNDFGFVKVKVRDGIIDESSLHGIAIPKRPVIYCQLNRTTFTQFEEVKRLLEDRFKPVDIRLDSRVPIDHRITGGVGAEAGGEMQGTEGSDLMHDIRPVDLEEEIEIIRTCGKVHPDWLEGVVRIHRETEKRVSRKLESNYTAWNLLSLEFKNVFVYGNNRVNRIDFQGGVTNVSGPNRHGKSSICLMIMFALYHKTSFDSSQKSDILNKWAREGFIKLVFQHNNHKYLVHKTISKLKRSGRKNEDADIYSTDFSRITPEGELVSLNATSSTATLVEIQKYVGTFDNFIANNTLLNRLTHSVLYQRPAERISRFLGLFQLNCYEQHVNVSKVVAAEIKEELTSVRNDLRVMEGQPKICADELERELEKVVMVAQRTESQLIVLQERLNGLMEQKAQQEETRIQLGSRDPSVNKPTRSREQLQELLQRLKEELKGAERPYQSLELLRHRLTQIQIDEAHNLDDCLKEIGDMHREKPNRDRESLETEHQSVLLEENESVARMRILKQLLSEQSRKTQFGGPKDNTAENGETEAVEEECCSDESLEKLEREVESLRKSIKSLPLSESELRLRIEKLRSAPFHLLKRKSVETTEQLIADCLEKLGKLKACLIPESDVESYDLKIDGSVDGNTGDRGDERRALMEAEVRRLRGAIVDLRAVPERMSGCETSDLDHLKEELIQTEAKILELEAATGKIDKNDVTLRMRQLHRANQSKAQCMIDVKLIEQTVRVLETSDDVFRKLGDLCRQRETTTARVREVESGMKHNQRVNEIIHLNEELLKNNRSAEMKANYVKNIITETEISRLQKQIAFLKNQILLIKQRKELDELMEMSESVKGNEKASIEIDRMSRRINWIRYRRILMDVDECEARMRELISIKTEICKGLDWYKHMDRLKNLANNLKEHQRITGEIALANKFEEMSQIVNDVEQWKKYNANLERLTEIEETERRLTDLRCRISEIEKEVQCLNRSSFVNQKDAERIEGLIRDGIDRDKKITNLTKKAIDLERTLEEHKCYQEIWNPKGLPLSLLKKKLKCVEPMINELFCRYTGYKVEFEIHKEKKLLITVACESPNGERTHLGLDRLSGSEYALLNLAFKSVCNRLSPLGRSTLFIVDETFDCLDKHHWRTALPVIFEMLKIEYLNVIFISHRNIPDDMIDNRIIIRKQDGYSWIQP